MNTPGLDKAIAGLRRAKAAVTRATRYAIMKEARRQGLAAVTLSVFGNTYERDGEYVKCEEIDALFEQHQEEVDGLGLDDWCWSIYQSQAGRGGESSMTPPDRACMTQAEWDGLDEESRTFLIEAEAGGLRYLAEHGEVCAWGPAYAGLFSVDITARRDPDGYLITLAGRSLSTSHNKA